jgi:TonB family protein
MSSASLLTRFLFSGVVVLLLVVSEGAYAGSPQQDNPTQEPDAPERIIHMRPPELEAAVTSRVEPIHPAVATWAGISGSVMVQVLVNQQGDVISATPVTGHPLLRNAAATAARDWKFKPAEADGKPVKMDGMVTIGFLSMTFQPGSMSKVEDVDKAKAAVQGFPDSPEAYFWLATSYADDDQNKDAVKAFNKAIELKPSYEEAYEELIKLYEESKATADVLRTYQQAVENNPNSLTLLTGQARALSDAKRYADAVDVMRRALDINPDDTNALHLLAWDFMQLKRFDEAVTTIKEELKITPTYPGALHNLGWSYYMMKRYDDAIATYQKIINLKTPYPGMSGVYREMGLALLQSNRTTESIDAFNHAIELKGEVPDVYCGLAAAYLRDARIDEALESLKKGVQERPKDSCIYANLGAINVRMGKLQEAEPYFRKAIELSPDRVLGYGNLASTLRLQKKDAEAESVLRQGIKSIVDNAPLRVMLGSLLSRTKWSEAEAQFKEVLRVDPNNAPALNDYGYYLAVRGERLNEALEMTQRAVNAAPDNSAYLDSLGWAYFKLGRLEEAERYLNKALQGSYKSSEMYEHLGDIYEKEGHRELSIEMWQKALALNPPAEDAKRLKAKLHPDSPNKN